MIALYKIKITEKKTGIKITELEVVGSTKEAMESDDFYKERAMRNAGYDTNTDKWDVSKFNFTAELIKSLDGEIQIK